MIKYELRTCPKCGHLHSVKVRRPNHILHLLLCVITLGLWIPIWFLAVFESAFSGRRQPACVRCKAEAKGRWAHVSDARSRH